MSVKEYFENIFLIDGDFYTKNLVKGFSVYGERIVEIDGVEYRFWNPYRSKAAAALKKGISVFPLKRDSKVLYLGASTGTTVSHFSDIVDKGVVFAVELSPLMMDELIERVASKRENVVPILSDARKIENYAEIGEVDVLYQDVSQRDQAEIFLKNANFLKKGGFGMFCVKSQSIDVVKSPREVYKEVKDKISPYFEILDETELFPYDKEHLFLVVKKY